MFLGCHFIFLSLLFFGELIFILLSIPLLMAFLYLPPPHLLGYSPHLCRGPPGSPRGIISRQTDGKRNGSCKSFGNSLNVRSRLLFWARTIFQCTRHELLLRCLLKGSLTVSTSKGAGSSLCPLRRNTLHRFQLPAEIQAKLVGRREKERRRFEVRVYFQTCKNSFCDRSVR